MSLIRWEPFREVDEFLRKYSPSLERSLFKRNGEDVMEWSPTANISETEKEYVISAELPGVKKEDVKITLSDGVLSLSGERKQRKESKDENELRMESFYGTFSRSFSLPDDVDDKTIRAESKDGMLSIHIARKEGVKSKVTTIPVQ